MVSRPAILDPVHHGGVEAEFWTASVVGHDVDRHTGEYILQNWIVDREVAAEFHAKLGKRSTSDHDHAPVHPRCDECTGQDERVPDGAPPKARIAVSGWLWFMDGACLAWIERRDPDREEMRDLLLGVLMGALIAAGSPPDLAQVS